MKNLNQILALFVTLLLLGALVIAGITAMDYTRTLYAALDPQLAHALIASLFAALVVAWFVVRVTRKANTLRMRNQLKDEITATYQYFVDYWIGAMDRANESGGDPEALQTLDRLMTLYGGAEVLKVHLSMRGMQQDQDARADEMRAQFGKALLAMRQELGAGTAGIPATRLQQLVMPGASAVRPSPELPQPAAIPEN